MHPLLEKVLVTPETITKMISSIDINSSLVYVAGSIAEGFGNVKSDVDIYVICHDENLDRLKNQFSSNDAVLQVEQCVVWNVRVDGVRYDFEFWSWNCFNDMINRLNKLDFKTENYLDRLTYSEFDLLHRLKFAKPLVNPTTFYNIYEKIEFENLNYYSVVTSSERYAGLLEDLQGSIISEDIGSAVVMARLLLDVVVNSYLSVYGETNPNPKWMFRKIKRYQQTTGDHTLLDKYQSYLISPEYINDSKKYVKEVVKYCQELNLRVQGSLRDKQLS
ncbi:hypothetical protein T458_24430 [Brevibacillus panacihumi W25]|uniref:Polymerase nucleotidyl transferase domain-containing protein n=1 Tax=Brevibacillus panacihumi W25 TaxID=1408254 RepID=V6M9Z3_9BACL|nr:hypothetical protein [Brevibacillus panacihumi]EST52168.1 hypothetical protein T458_24430 [Brevibacillus panacihumi W25]